MKINFGFEYFFTDSYTLRTNVTNLKLLDYDVTDVSDIEYRQRIGYMAGSSDTTDGKMISYRLRLRDSYGDLLLPIHIGDTKTTEIKNNHNSLYFLPDKNTARHILSFIRARDSFAIRRTEKTLTI